MAASDVTVGTIFISQTVVGILGNSSLLSHYLLLYFTGCRLRSTDLIIQHLIVANFLTLLCKGVPQTMAAFGLKDFLSDLGCKLLFYLHRVGRGVSICSTCLLTVLQAITISPRDSRWAEIKVKAPRYIGPCIFLSWILSLLVNCLVLMHMTRKWSNKNSTSGRDFGYCSSIPTAKKTESIVYAVILALPDVVGGGLMLWASSSMVSILYRHKQRMQQVSRTNMSPGSSPASRATKTILLLVSSFVYFYTLSCIFQVCLAVVYSPSWSLVNTAAIVAGCFPTVSPFLLMSRDSSASGFCSAWIRNRNTTTNHLRNM